MAKTKKKPTKKKVPKAVVKKKGKMSAPEFLILEIEGENGRLEVYKQEAMYRNEQLLLSHIKGKIARGEEIIKIIDAMPK